MSHSLGTFSGTNVLFSSPFQTVKRMKSSEASRAGVSESPVDALPDELMDQQQRDSILRELMDFPAVVS